MSPFFRKNNQLYVETCALSTIIGEAKTPCYIYATSAIRENYQCYARHAGHRATICYAIKANSNQAILRLLAKEGAGADIVSEGEARRAIAAGIKPERIFFSGVGKHDEALRFALHHQLGQINIESAEEIRRLAAIAQQRGQTAPCAIRVNPNIDSGSHDKITTGRQQDKFGISFNEAFALYQEAQSLDGIRMTALAMHIGSQITDLDIFQRAFDELGQLALALRAEGAVVHRLDLGGGLGIGETRDLQQDIANYSRRAAAIANQLDCDIILSPGRSIVGNAGCLVATIMEVKQAGDKHFLIMDAAMNDLLRPTLYHVNHPVWPVQDSPQQQQSITYQLVGQICESGDILGRDIRLPPQQAGGQLAFMQAGAYGAVLSSAYNSRLLVPELLVEKNRFAIIRKRPTYEELMAIDQIPNWLLS